MEPEFWLERWRLNETGFHQRSAHADLQRYWAGLRIPVTSRVFVPLCGKSLDLAWLRAQGHEVVGVELAEAAVRDFFASQALQPVRTRRDGLEWWEGGGISIACGDFFALGPLHLKGVAAVYDRAALIALPPAMRGPYAEHMQRIVPAAAVILQITLDYPQAQMNGPPFAVPPEELQTLYGARYEILSLAVHDTLAEEPRFRERGLRQLHERTDLLRPRSVRSYRP